MLRRRKRAPGELVYLSERKLHGLAADLRVDAGRLEPEVEFERSAGAQVKVPPLGGLSAQGRVRGTRNDPLAGARAEVELLDAVLDRLGRLPDLEKREDVLEGGFFRFERFLRFGVGHSDRGPAIKALIAVDREPVPRDLSRTGLLMNGSIVHVRDPYATEELRAAPGSRSGSGTERLFNWLDEARRAWEENPPAPMREIAARTQGPPRGTDDAIAMYRLFAEGGWLDEFLAEPVRRGAPCEGVARASFIAPGEEMTIVMGSPLYIRIAPLRQA
jgi:hypothetical protein